MKPSKNDVVKVMCDGVADFLNFSRFGAYGGWIPERYKIFHNISYVNKYKLKIRVPGWHDPGVLPAG